MLCLSSAKFSMRADILRPEGAPEEAGGHWEYQQDPDSGAIEQVWVADPDAEGPVTARTFKCIARSAVTGGLRGAEQFGEEYLNEEWVKLTFPFSVNLTLRDKVTNIRTSKGVMIWTEESMEGNPATVFDVTRVSPVVDGFGQVIENVALLKRAGVQ